MGGRSLFKIGIQVSETPERIFNVFKNGVIAGVDIGGTKTAVVFSAELPTVIKRTAFPTCPSNGPEPILTRIVDSLHESLDSRELKKSKLGAIGVSCGSPLDPLRGVIQQPPNLPTWKDVPIKTILEREFGVPCYLENDANAGALAEYRFGAGKGTQNMVFVTMGTGIGAGLILNGRLYRGTTFMAGEIGHVRLTQTGPPGHNKPGAVEGWASGAGVAHVARTTVKEASANGEKTSLREILDGNGSPLSARDVWLAAQHGDVIAGQIIKSTGEKLGEALAILVDVLNPECIVIGGLAIRMKENLLEPARSVVAREALSESAHACRITSAALGEQIGDIAALCVAVEGQTLVSVNDEPTDPTEAVKPT